MKTELADEHLPSTEECEALVIGGGPAGAVAAKALAAAGVQTLMVEAKAFPRRKVCGGCLNQRAIAGLRSIGLTQPLETCGGEHIEGVEITHRGRSLYVTTPPGLAVTRASLDTTLAQAVSMAGVEVRFGVRATVLPPHDSPRRVQLTYPSGETSVVESRVVVVADGLGAPSLSHLPRFQTRIDSRSRIGIGAVLEGPGAEAVTLGRIHMAVADRGYLGMVRCEKGRLDLAAAIDAHAIGRGETIGRTAMRLLEEAGVDPPAGMEQVPWHGTRRLTQAMSDVADDRLFVIGDAAGYIEPFTGEGMAIAIEEAIAVAPLAIQAVREWRDSLAEEWRCASRAHRQARARDCRHLAWLLRRRWATDISIRIASVLPAVSKVIARRIASPNPLA